MVLCRLNQERGQTFVLVTHSPEVGEVADRIIRMRDGVVESDVGNGHKSLPEVNVEEHSAIATANN